jgi:biotin carboxyl carrier protein
MKLTEIFKDNETQVEVIELDHHTFKVILGDTAYEIDARNCSSDLMSILVENKSYDISYSFDGDNVELNFRNKYFNIEVLDERKMRMRNIRSDFDISGPETIKTTMPGKVVKILVKEGDQVEPGSGIIIIEAMKMENEILCQKAGIVKTVHVEENQNVEGDLVLVEIAPEEEED